MSYTSIAKNDEAKQHIIKTRNLYNSAINVISSENDNPKTDRIINLIKEEIKYLNYIENRINASSSSIRWALAEKERLENEENANS